MTNQEFADPRFNLPPDLTDPLVQAIEDAKAEEARQRRAQEAAEQQEQQMVAEEPAVASWPDNGFQATPQSGVDKVAGALRVGQAGHVAFARDLLNSEAPLGAVGKPEGTAAGAQESAAGSRAARPALGLG